MLDRRTGRVWALINARTSADDAAHPLLWHVCFVCAELLAADGAAVSVTSGREVQGGGAGWANVGLRRADAAHVELGEHVLDGALCTLGLSAMPNRELAIANVHRALKPRSRFVVLDIPPFEGIARVFNPIVKPVYKYTANWRPDTDLAADLRQAFGDVVVQTFNARTLLLAVATKQ